MKFDYTGLTQTEADQSRRENGAKTAMQAPRVSAAAMIQKSMASQ